MAEYVKVALASELEPNHGKLVEVQGRSEAGEVIMLFAYPTSGSNMSRML